MDLLLGGATGNRLIRLWATAFLLFRLFGFMGSFRTSNK